LRGLVARRHGGSGRQQLCIAQYQEFRHLADPQERRSVAKEGQAYDGPVAKPHCLFERPEPRNGQVN